MNQLARSRRADSGPRGFGPGDGALVRALRRPGHGGRHARSAAPVAGAAAGCPWRALSCRSQLIASLVEGTSIRAVFRSPGLSPASVAAVQNAAQAMGLWTGGELSLFTQALAELKASRGYAPQVLAITGTNGKTTVTSLTGQLVERAGKSVVVAGNIGPTLLDTLGASLDADALPEVWVLELSSFQLDGASDFEPTAATVLNLTQDHLDWHGSMEAYCGGQGERLRRARADGSQSRRSTGHGHAARTRPGPAATPGRARNDHFRRRHAAAPGRLRHRTGRTAWPGWCAPWRPTKRADGARTTRKSCTSSA